MKRSYWLLWLLSWLALAPAGFAHGGGTPQLVNAPAGAYLISAWSQPDPVRVGTLHLTIAVAQADTFDPILEASVTIELLHSSGQQRIAQATHEQATNKLFYESDVEIDTTGEWAVIIVVNESEAVGFPLNVLPPLSPLRRFGPWLAAGLGLMALLLFSRFRHAPPKNPL